MKLFVLPLLFLLACAHVQNVVTCTGGDVSPEDVTRILTDVNTGNDADLVAEGVRLGWDILGCVIAELEKKGAVTHEAARKARNAHAELRS